MAVDQKLIDAGVVKDQQEMGNKYESMKGTVRQLQDVIDSLEGQWQGIGRAAFDKKQIEINQSMGALGNILAEVVEAMTETRKLKDKTEDEIEANIARIEATSSSISKL